MATVGITKELRKRTKEMIDQMRKNEIACDVPGYDTAKKVVAAELYHLGCWGKDHTHLINVIPKDWLRVDKGASITITGTDENGRDITFNQSFEAPTPVFYGRPSTDYWNRADSKLSMALIYDMPEETLGRKEILERWASEAIVRTINERWQKVETDIDEFLDKCKSLNEAVKLFPGVRMYIQYEDIQRLDRKLERPTQRAKIVEDMDTEGLTAAAIAAKLSAA